LEIPAFDASSEFYDVEGIPVSFGVCVDVGVPPCAAWDVSPPCRFDPAIARRDGIRISQARFNEMVIETFAGVY
jgi:hypothetical protein